MLLHSPSHLRDRFILLFLVLLSILGLCPEHIGQQFRVLLDLLQSVCQVLLILSGLLQPWLIPVFIAVYLLLRVTQLRLELYLVRLQILHALFLVLYLHFRQ